MPARQEPKSPTPAPKRQTKIADYFPGSPGAVWKYEGHGNEFAQFERSATHREGNKLQLEDASGTVMASVYVITDNEIRRVYSEPEFYSKKSLLNAKENRSEVILKAPIAAGQKWQNGSVVFTIEAIDLEVKVPAGTYRNVIAVSRTETKSDWVTTEYFAPNVGLVKMEGRSKDGQYVVTSLLESYIPGK